jgi:hypothetical protein
LALAAGAAGSDVETYVLVANATSTPGTVTFTTLPLFGIPSVSRSFPIAANSRFSMSMTNLLNATGGGGPGYTFGTLVESDGPEIIVERAMYTNYGGIVWAAGTDALGTPLP